VFEQVREHDAQITIDVGKQRLSFSREVYDRSMVVLKFARKPSAAELDTPIARRVCSVSQG